MLVLIVKDSSTQVPKDISVEEAQGYEDQGLAVLVVIGEGETQPLKEWRAFQDARPEPETVAEAEPVEEMQEPVAVTAPAKKTTAKKKTNS